MSGKFFFDSIADNGPTYWAETLGTGFGPTSDWLIVPGWDRAETEHPAELAQKSGQTQEAPSEQRQARQSQLSGMGKLRPGGQKHLARSSQHRQREMGLIPGLHSPSSTQRAAWLKSSPARAAHCVAVCGAPSPLGGLGSP